MINTIIFDLDETLLDRTNSLIHFCQWQAKQLNLKGINRERFTKRFIELDANGSVWKDQVYAQLKQEFMISQTVDELLFIYIEQFQNFCIANPEVNETIIKLYQYGYQLGLISNGKTPFQENNFKHLQLSPYFSSIIVSEAVQLRKPDPAIFLLACQQLNVQPEQCLFIGDNEIVDVQGAQQAGMTAVWYNPQKHLSSTTIQHSIQSMSEIFHVITL